MDATTIIDGDEAVLTVPEIARKTRCKTGTVHLWLRTGKLDGIKIGRCWLTTHTALVDFLNSKNGATP